MYKDYFYWLAGMFNGIYSSTAFSHITYVHLTTTWILCFVFPNKMFYLVYHTVYKIPMQSVMGHNLHHCHSPADESLAGKPSQVLHSSHQTAARYFILLAWGSCRPGGGHSWCHGEAEEPGVFITKMSKTRSGNSTSLW